METDTCGFDPMQEELAETAGSTQALAPLSLNEAVKPYPWERRFLEACLFNDGIGSEEAYDRLGYKGIWELKELIERIHTADISREMVEQIETRIKSDNLPT